MSQTYGGLNYVNQASSSSGLPGFTTDKFSFGRKKVKMQTVLNRNDNEELRKSAYKQVRMEVDPNNPVRYLEIIIPIEQEYIRCESIYLMFLNLRRGWSWKL